MDWRGDTKESQGPVSHPGMLVPGLRWTGPFRCDTSKVTQMPFRWGSGDTVPKGGTIAKLKEQGHLVVSVNLVGRILFYPPVPIPREAAAKSVIRV